MGNTEPEIVNMRRSGGDKRPVNSNIGVRRRQIPSCGHSARSQSHPRRSDGVSESRVTSTQDEGSLLHRRDLVCKSSHSQTQHPKCRQRASGRIQVAAPSISNRRASTDSDSSQRTLCRNRISNEQMSRGSSDTDSPSTILINPDLNMLPVVKTYQAEASFDFHINSYITSIIEVSPFDVDKYPHVVHQMLHDEMLFTAFTTCSEAAKWRVHSLYDDPPIDVVRGYGRTISLLSERLRSGKFTMSSAILLTMGQLVAIESLIKNVSATAKHLAGMQSMMSSKNAVKPPTNPSPVQTAVEVWTAYFEHRTRIRAAINSSASLTYPKHPFPSNVSRQVSELPIGFADVALSGQLSTKMLDLMDGFNTYFLKINKLINAGITDSSERTNLILQQTAYCIEFVQICTLTLVERLVLVALTAYVVRRDRIHPALVNVRNYYQIMCGHLSNVLTTTPLIRAGQDGGFSTWIGLMLLLTSTPEAYARKLALKLLPGRPEPLKMLKLCQDYFWDDDLTNALLSGGVLSAETSNDIIADNVRWVIHRGAD